MGEHVLLDVSRSLEGGGLNAQWLYSTRIALDSVYSIYYS